MNQLLKTVSIWLLLAMLSLASPVITFEGTFTNNQEGILEGYHSVTARLIKVSPVFTQSSNVIWSETNDVFFTKGFMSFEYGRKSKILPSLLNNTNLMFEIQINDQSGVVRVPLTYQTHSSISDLTKKATIVDSIKATAIQGIIEPHNIQGVYPQITGLGVLTSPLTVKETLYIQPDQNKIGINTDKPTNTLSVNGDIKTTKGILFPDGTLLNSTKALTDGGGPIISTGSVIIKTDTDQNKTGHFEIKIGNISRVLLKKTGNTFMGINMINPKQSLDINGAIRIQNTTIEHPGTLRYQNEKIEGFNGQNWITISTKEEQGGGWLFNPTTQISYAPSHIKFGIGKAKPRGKLDINGQMFAKKLIGKFNGNGHALTHLSLTQFSGKPSLNQGGTGAHLATPNRLIMINKDNNKLTEMPELQDDQLLIGQDTGTATPNRLHANEGLSVSTNPQRISINHTLSPIVEQAPVNNQYIHNLQLNQYGHLEKIVTQSMDQISNSKQHMDAHFVTKTKGVIQGPLSIQKHLILKQPNTQLSTHLKKPILIPTQHKVGIGVLEPKTQLDINGGIRIGYSNHTTPGAIRYDSTHDRFSGRTKKGWVSLDAQNNATGGWVNHQNTLTNINSNIKVGIGVTNPKEALHVNGLFSIENNATIQKQLIIDKPIFFNQNNPHSNTIGPLNISGIWDLSHTQLNKLKKLNAKNIQTSGLFTTKHLTTKQPLATSKGISIGSLDFINNTINGNINFTNGTLTNLKTLQVGQLSILNHSILSQTGEINLTQPIHIQNTIKMSKNTLLAESSTPLKIKSKQHTLINGITLHNQHIQNIQSLNINNTLTVNRTSQFDKKLTTKKNLNIKNNPSLLLSIGQNQQYTEQVSVSGDIVIGTPTHYVQYLTPKADLIIEGNLIINNKFHLINNKLNALSSTGKTELSRVSGQVSIGETTSRNAKVIVKSTGNTAATPHSEWYKRSGKKILKLIDNGNLGIGEVETPAAILHIGHTQSTIPHIIFPTSPSILNPTSGQLNYNGTHINLTLDDLSQLNVLDVKTTENILNKTISSSIFKSPSMNQTLTFLSNPLTFKTNGQNHFYISTQEKVGLSTNEPKSTLDINGAIKISTANNHQINPGTIQYKDHTFYSYNQNIWVKLNFSDSDTPWIATENQLTTTKMVGIKKNSPQTALDVSGTVSANSLIGKGTLITHLQAQTFKDALPTIKGGTGQSSFVPNSILIGNRNGKIQNMVLKKGELLIGNGNNSPIPGHIKGKQKIEVESENHSITIKHHTLPNHTPITISQNEILTGVGSDTFGHLQSATKKQLIDRYYNKQDTDSRYINSTGDTLTGPLTLTSPTVDIQSSNTHPNIIVKLGTNGKVGIGMTDPKTTLDIKGGLRISQGIPKTGVIQYHNNKFQGYGIKNGIPKWRNLDQNNHTTERFTAPQFIGDGAQVTHIQPHNFSAPLPVTKGGTGHTSVTNNTPLISNNQNPFLSLALKNTNTLLIGNNKQAPSAATLNSGIGISITHSVDTISIQQKNAEPVNTNKLGNKTLPNHHILSNVTISSLGHILDYETKNLNDNFHTPSQTESLLIKKDHTTNSLISGTLTSKTPQNTPTFTTPDSEHFAISPATNKNVNIGKIEAQNTAILNISKGVKIASSATLSNNATEGTLRFENNSFYGKGSRWFKLDTEQNITGTLVANKVTTNDGSKIKNLNISEQNLHTRSLINIKHGGTGSRSLDEGSLLLGSQSNALNSIKLRHNKTLVMKNYNTPQLAPVYLSDRNNGLIVSGNNQNKIQILHKKAPTSLSLSIQNPSFHTLKTVKFDTLGHVTEIVTKDIKPFFNTRSETTNNFINLSGDSLNGQLTLDTSHSGFTTQVGDHRHFNIIPANNGNVKISNKPTASDPTTLLDIDGALTIGNKRHTTTLTQGLLFWNGSHYKGFDGQNILSLDNQLEKLGLTKEGSTTTLTKKMIITPPPNNTPYLSTNGTIKANTLDGKGTKLTHLNPTNFSSSIPINLGGTGLNSTHINTAKMGTFIMYNINGATKEFKLTDLEERRLLFGQDNNAPLQVSLCCDDSPHIKLTTDINHAQAYTVQLNEKLYPFSLTHTPTTPSIIKNITIDQQGLITQISKTPLSDITYTRNNATELFINQTGDTLINKLRFANNAPYQINTSLTKPLSISASKVGIGVLNPGSQLHINGGLQLSPKVADREENGSIVFNNSNRFISRVNNKWLHLDNEIEIINWMGNDTKAYTPLTTQKIGIGTPNPSSLLHIDGTLQASHFVSLDGSQITNLHPNNLDSNKQFTSAQGGTNQSHLNLNELIISDPATGLRTRPLDNLTFIKGTPKNSTAKINFKNSPLTMNMTHSTITFKHAQENIPNNFDPNKKNKAIKRLMINASGHITDINYDNISSHNILSKREAEKNFLFKHGDTLTGRITASLSAPYPYTIESTKKPFTINAPQISINNQPIANQKLTIGGTLHIETNEPKIRWQDTKNNKTMQLKLANKQLQINDKNETVTGLIVNYNSTHPRIGVGTKTPISTLHIKQPNNTPTSGIGIYTDSSPKWNIYERNNHLSLSKDAASPVVNLASSKPKIGIKTDPITSIHLKQTNNNPENGLTLENTNAQKWQLYTNPTELIIQNKATPTQPVISFNKNKKMRIGFNYTTGTEDGTLEIKGSSTAKGLSIENTANQSWSINHHGENGLQLESPNQPQLTIKKDGKVGFHTTNPSTTLHINSSMNVNAITVNQYVNGKHIALIQNQPEHGLILTDSNAFHTGSSGHGIKFETKHTNTSENRTFRIGWASATNKTISTSDEKGIHLSNLGNVGINKAPQTNYKLDINGSGQISNTLTAGQINTPSLNIQTTKFTTTKTNKLFTNHPLTITNASIENLITQTATFKKKTNINNAKFNTISNIGGSLSVRNVTINNNTTIGTNTNTLTIGENLVVTNTSDIQGITQLNQNLNIENNTNTNILIQEKNTKSFNIANGRKLSITPGNSTYSITNNTSPLTIIENVANKVSASNLSDYYTNSLPHYQFQINNNTTTFKFSSHSYNNSTKGDFSAIYSNADLILNENTSSTIGKVGIGLNNPSKKLDVNGNTTISNKLYAKTIIDNGNNAYKLDPNNTSKLNTLNLELLINDNSLNSTHIVDRNIISRHFDDNEIYKFDTIKANKLNINTTTPLIYNKVANIPTLRYANKFEMRKTDHSKYLAIENEKTYTKEYIYGRSNIDSSTGTIRFHSTNGTAITYTTENSHPTLRFYASSTHFASWNGDANWDFSSDKRLKENITTAPNMLERLMKIDIVNYRFKSDPSNKKKIGVIAQNLQTLFPNYVSGNESKEHLSVTYMGLGIIAIKGIQELQKEMRNEIKSINKKNESITLEQKEKFKEIALQQENIQNKIDTALAKIKE